MNNDLSQFRKIKSTPHMTILRHPLGHEITIAHAGLGDGLKKELEKIPVHLAEGGDPGAAAADPALADIEAQIAQTPAQEPVPEESTAHAIGRNLRDIPGPTSLPLEFAKKALEQGGKFVSGLTGEEEQQPKAASGQQAQESNPKLANYQMPAALDQAPAPQQVAYTSPYEEEAKAAQHQAESAQKLQTWAQGHMEAIDKERAAIQDDIAKGHIDPNQYIHEMGTGQKIGAAIGLIMGGLAGGATGGKNVAVDYLNQQIDKNINAQMADLGKKQNLLSSLTQHFGNVKDAVEMSRAVQNDLYAAQMQKAMTQIQDPMKKQQMLMAIQHVQAQAQGAAQRVAYRQGAQSAVKQGGIDPQMAANYIISDPKDKEQASKEIANAKSIEALRGDVLQSFYHLQNKPLAGAFSPSDRSSAINTFGGRLGTLAEHRFNLQESIQQMNAVMPSPLDSAETKRNKLLRLNQLFDSLRTTPMLDAYGIKVGAPAQAIARPIQAAPMTSQSRGPNPMKVNFNGG